MCILFIASLQKTLSNSVFSALRNVTLPRTCFTILGYKQSAATNRRQLTPCVGDGDGNSLNLDAIDADRLHRLSCGGELRRVQRYHPPRRSNFCQSPFLPPPRQCPFGAGRRRSGDGGDRRGGGRCRGDRVLELHRLPLAQCCFEEELREENATRMSG